jgi:hypothetical protein
MREQARAYLRAIAAERGKASFAQRLGRGFQDADALTSAGARLFPLLLVLAALLTAGQMAPSFLAVSGDVRAWSLVAFIAGLGLALLWFFWSLARAVDRLGAASVHDDPPTAPAAQEPEGSVRSACASCGAPVTFVVGQASARCPYCGATVVATAADQAAMVSIAGHRADLEQARASRAIHRQLAGRFQGMARGLSLMRWALSIGMPSVILIVLGASFLRTAAPVARHHRGRHGPPPAPPVFETMGLAMVGAGVGILVVAVGVGLLVSYLSRPRAIGRAIAALRAHARGRVSAGGVIPALDWLDAHWAGPAPDAVVSSAASDGGDPVQRWTLDFSHGGRPAMVVVAHAPHIRRIDVFLAAYRRRDPSSPVGQEAGFFAEVGQAGVHLWHEDSDPSALRPELIDRVLAHAAAMAS